MTEVTKTKSEGRIAAGKRLAEWNRKNKEKLKQVPALSAGADPEFLSGGSKNEKKLSRDTLQNKF